MNDLLAINAGSSSIKFAQFRSATSERRFFESLNNVDKTAADIADWLEERIDFRALSGVGHRIVHGLNFVEPVLITRQVLDDLHRISPHAPEHMPAAIALIEEIRARHREMPQVACFDTMFHRDLPVVARTIAIPRRFAEIGVRRYGFHGLSYSFLMQELARIEGSTLAQGRIILAHLGGGSSLAAVRHGKCIDTSMGFTPSGGMPMATRCGDIDPGIPWFLMTVGMRSPIEVQQMLNQESGLLGISGTTGDMQKLISAESTDPHAAEAVDVYCYQARKWIGAFSAALDGLDTLVFSGGIGEHSPEIRSRICAGLRFLGIELDPVNNLSDAPLISANRSNVRVRVIKTNEEMIIARYVCDLLQPHTA